MNTLRTLRVKDLGGDYDDAAQENWFVYEYERPAVTCDIVVVYNPALIRGFQRDDNEHLEVLTIRRKNDPYKGLVAIPGGFLNIDETLADCAERELEEETSLKLNDDPIFVGMYDEPNRDSRTRVVTAAFAYVLTHKPDVCAGDDAEENSCEWIKVDDLLKMEVAFDHKTIIMDSIQLLKNRMVL